MNLKGKHTYKASPQQIWDILMDTEKLAKITPGVSRLELTGENQYNAVSDIKIGPVKGTFKGDLFLENKEEPTGFTLRVKQLSKIGNADATVHIQINDQEGEECELAFNGKAKLSGTLARTGQRVLTGVANSLTKQFFKALEEEINSSKEVVESIKTETVIATPNEVNTNLNESTTTIEKIANTSTSNQKFSFLAWFKKLIGMS